MAILSLHIMLASLAAFVAASPRATNTTCTPRPGGAGPIPQPDTPDAFIELQAFRDAAKSAKTPRGFVQVYIDQLVAYNDPALFLAAMELQSYDAQSCASFCDSDKKCKAFDIFFERNPSLEIGPGCLNPPSTTTIKCTLWAGAITNETSFNHGQFQSEFKIVMAGSNGYVKEPFTPPKLLFPGYIIDKYAYGSAIEAPLDCHGNSTYLSMRYWHDGNFEIQRCLDVCNRMNDCHFVNTYMQLINRVPYSQHCALYTAHWPVKYAVNKGQIRDKDNIEVSLKESFGLTSSDGLHHEACEPNSFHT